MLFFFSRWVQKRREERQLIKETEARKAERRIHREKRDDQQAQALFLTLCELQRTIDPLMAVQIYNSRLCPLISRLPEELLLCILDYLCDDVIALQCLRIVSRIFLQILNSQSVVWREACSIRNEAFYLHNVPRPQPHRRVRSHRERPNTRARAQGIVPEASKSRAGPCAPRPMRALYPRWRSSARRPV